MTILYFTATGNSLYVAKSFGGELISISSAMKGGKLEFEDDKIGVVFPVYSNKVMPYVEEFLMKATFKCDYLFSVMSYGIFAAGASVHLKDIADRAGIAFDYINVLKMVDNWIPGFKMEQQIKDEHKKHIDEHLAVVVADVAQSKRFVPKISGFSKLFTAQQVKSAAKPQSKGSKYGAVIGRGIKDFATIEQSCIGCGICSKVCPVDNITVDKQNKSVLFGDYCLSCFACTHNCPTNSIRFKGERSRARYRNSHITINEIVEANNR